MALDKGALKDGLINLHTDMSQRDENSIEEYAERLSDLIDSFVKSGKVKAGITVTTAGNATNHTGATTGLGEII